MIERRESFGVTGRIELKVWDVPKLESAEPRWSSLSKSRRLRLLREEVLGVEPEHVGGTENMVLDNYLEALALGQNPEPSHLALGDGTTAPDATNDSLNNEVYRTIVGDDESENLDRITSTLISQNEAVGSAIREMGFADGPRSGRWMQMTQAILDTVDQVDEKTSNMAITINYILEYRRNST